MGFDRVTFVQDGHGHIRWSSGWRKRAKCATANILIPLRDFSTMSAACGLLNINYHCFHLSLNETHGQSNINT
jgi:hypothetical protein